MICFINGFNLINTNEFGILAWQNTSDALTEFLDKTYDASQSEQGFTNNFFLDFSKAFDTVDHENLWRIVLVWL